jgi:hypothetical protein
MDWPSVVVSFELDAGGSVEACRPPRLGGGDRAAEVGVIEMPSSMELGISEIGS